MGMRSHIEEFESQAQAATNKLREKLSQSMRDNERLETQIGKFTNILREINREVETWKAKAATEEARADQGWTKAEYSPSTIKAAAVVDQEAARTHKAEEAIQVAHQQNR
eukprot:SAG11_NODE_510_length_8851_cov_25.360718_5_plen_110_part_00